MQAKPPHPRRVFMQQRPGFPPRPSRKPLVRYKSFRYQAKSWTTPRRIVAKVEHHRGELSCSPASASS